MPSTHFGKRYSITYDTCTYILLFGLLITVAFTYHMYGFTTDELVDHLKATRIFEFIASGGIKREQILKIDLINIYGGMPDMLALGLQKLIPALSFDSRHLVSALFGLAGIYYAYSVGSVFVSPSVGFLTALLLTFNPMWFGYMFINAKDIPSAATLLGAFYYCLCALTGRDELQWSWARVGLAAGLLASTKLTGVLVLGLIGFLALAALVAVPTSSRLRIDRVFFFRLLMTAISGLVGCLICFAVFWPQFFF